MKNTLRILFIALAFLSLSALAQTSEVRTVDKFTSIANSTSGNIYLKQGSPQRVELEGKPATIASIETEVSGGKLKIRVKSHNGTWSWFHDDELKIRITAENIDGIEINGSGDLTAVNKLSGSNLIINLNGSGNLAAEIGLTGTLEANVAGSGDINVKGQFQNLKGKVSGSGDLQLSAAVANQSEFDISGSGEIKVLGKAQSLLASVSGSGDLDAANFEVDKCSVRVSGSGNAEVFAKTELEARTSGSGDISYRGTPAKLSTHNSGSGSINKAQ
ncbi:hypothetical protein AAKU67_000397 [Oxalobacteraceae bacterium GrIS 2.11]